MRPYEFESFKDAVAQAQFQLQWRSKLVHTDHWQGVDIKSTSLRWLRTRSPMSAFSVPMRGYEHDLEAYAKHIEPNLPWADDHFEERVSAGLR
jgi:hypothetical protein